MKRIKAFALLLGVVVLASCASQKRVIYLQDTQADEQIKIAQDYQIRIKPLDRLTVVVNSRDPELAAPFNTSTSLNSLTGTPLSTYSSNSASLQIRTVDENGDLDMPIIGPIQCKGKTRSELAQEIADKIREGGYISDPTVNIQFADMKISALRRQGNPGGKRRPHHGISRSDFAGHLRFALFLSPAERRNLREAEQVPGPGRRNQPEPQFLYLAGQHRRVRSDSDRHTHPLIFTTRHDT